MSSQSSIGNTMRRSLSTTTSARSAAVSSRNSTGRPGVRLPASIRPTAECDTPAALAIARWLRPAIRRARRTIPAVGKSPGFCSITPAMVPGRAEGEGSSCGQLPVVDKAGGLPRARTTAPTWDDHYARRRFALLTYLHQAPVRHSPY